MGVLSRRRGEPRRSLRPPEGRAGGYLAGPVTSRAQVGAILPRCPWRMAHSGGLGYARGLTTHAGKAQRQFEARKKAVRFDAMKARGKVIVVTGAGSGMGRQVVLELLRRGARVAAVDRNEKTLAETAGMAHAAEGALATFTLDVTDRSAVEALPQRVVDAFGAVDGSINCAGVIQPFVRLNDLDYDAVDRVFNVNWRGTLYMTKSFLPLLLKRPEGHIVNISSMGGFLPVPGQTVYGASKAAVKLLTEGLHSELAATKVRVTVVFPGAVATNIAQNSGIDISAMAGSAASSRAAKTYPAERAARDIVDGMERDAFRVLFGSDSRLMDRLYRISPRRATAFIANQMKDLLGR
jgi:short-subunit dehydrogenase